MIKFPLGKTDFPYFLKLAFEELIIKNTAAMFKPFNIHGPALNSVVLDNLVGPFTKLYRPLVLDLKTYGNDCLQIVVVKLAFNFPAALSLNY